MHAMVVVVVAVMADGHSITPSPISVSTLTHLSQQLEHEHLPVLQTTPSYRPYGTQGWRREVFQGSRMNVGF
jgi:hypothetical protein